MVTVNKVDKKAEMSLLDIVKYQIVTYCYFEKIPISDMAALCLAYLCIAGKIELNKFCKLMSDQKLFATPQVVRNTITTSEERKLVIKEGEKRKVIYINPAINLQFQGNVLLDYKFFSRETV